MEARYQLRQCPECLTSIPIGWVSKQIKVGSVTLAILAITAIYGSNPQNHLSYGSTRQYKLRPRHIPRVASRNRAALNPRV